MPFFREQLYRGRCYWLMVYRPAPLRVTLEMLARVTPPGVIALIKKVAHKRYIGISSAKGSFPSVLERVMKAHFRACLQ